MKELKTLILDENDLKKMIAEKYGCEMSSIKIKIQNDGYGDEVIAIVSGV